MSKGHEKNPDFTGAAEKFGLLPEYPLSKKDRKLLKLVGGETPVDFFDLCRLLDAKPSKIEEKTAKLIALGLLTGEDGGAAYALTPAARQLLSLGKADRKHQKKFRAFLKTLNETEQQEFFSLCDRFRYTEAVCADESADEPENREEE